MPPHLPKGGLFARILDAGVERRGFPRFGLSPPNHDGMRPHLASIAISGDFARITTVSVGLTLNRAPNGSSLICDMSTSVLRRLGSTNRPHIFRSPRDVRPRLRMRTAGA